MEGGRQAGYCSCVGHAGTLIDYYANIRTISVMYFVNYCSSPFNLSTWVLNTQKNTECPVELFTKFTFFTIFVQWSVDGSFSERNSVAR
jgi:hypothetical protein